MGKVKESATSTNMRPRPEQTKRQKQQHFKCVRDSAGSTAFVGAIQVQFKRSGNPSAEAKCCHAVLRPSRIRALTCTLDLEREVTVAEAPRKNRWEGMTLHFVSMEVLVEGRNSEQLRSHIEWCLSREGAPVRWAVVESDETAGTCRIDAVVSRRREDGLDEEPRRSL